VNFHYDNILNVIQNTTDSHIHSTTGRYGYVLEHRFNKFSEIMNCNGHYAVQGFKVTDFGTNRKLIYDFLLVINTNLPTILHRFQVTGFRPDLSLDMWDRWKAVGVLVTLAVDFKLKTSSSMYISANWPYHCN